jgi:hypothetical protein
VYAILSKRERLGGRGLWRCGGGAAGDAYSPSDPGAAPLVRPVSRGEPMKLTTRTRRTLLKTALATTALAAPSVAYAAGNDAPSGLTDRYEFAEEAKSATIQLRPGIKFQNGALATPDDAWAKVTFRGCSARQMSSAPGGSFRPNIIRTSGKRVCGSKARRPN